jgi:tetratricopeptide (TPR) repeat protein
MKPIQVAARSVIFTMPTAICQVFRSGRPAPFVLALALSLAACEGHGEPAADEPAPATRQAPPDAEPEPAELALGYAPPEGRTPAPTDALILAAQDTVRAAPTSAEAHIALATLFLRRKRETGDTAFALYADDAVRVARQLGDDPRAELLHAMLLQDAHRFEEARDAAVGIIRIQPDMAMAYLVQGDALLELGAYDEAVDAYQRALDLRPDLRSYERGAHLRWLHGDPEGAIELLELAIDAGSARDPESMAFCFVDLGTIYLRAGDTRRALAAADRARELVPDYLPAMSLAGRAHEMAGDVDDAVRELSAVVARRPGADELLTLSELERARGDAPAADTHLALALRMASSEPRPVAMYLARHDQDAPEALRLAERELAARQNIEAFDTHALALLRVGRSDEALAAVDRALALGTPDARLHLHRALILAVRGDARGAAADLARARAINPRVDPVLVTEVERRVGPSAPATRDGSGA